MKKYLMGVFGLFSFMFCISIVAAAQNGGGGNYSKDKACRLPDGMYERNIQITNYPGYNTFIKNFIKENNILYYAIQATPMNEEGTSENLLWSWNCKTKKSKQLSQELLSYYSHQRVIAYKSNVQATIQGTPLPQVYDYSSDGIPMITTYGEEETDFPENSLEIDYMDSNKIIVRYKIKYNTCVQYDFKVGTNSIITEKGCSVYRNIVQYRHVVFDRKNMTQSSLGFDPNEERFTQDALISGYKHYVTTLRNKYLIVNCTTNDTQKQFLFTENKNIPDNSTCNYNIMNAYVVDIIQNGKNTVFSIKYGDGIKGYWGYKDIIKVNLLSHIIIP